MREKKKSEEIKTGEMIYAKPTVDHESPIVGTVLGYNEATKQYAIEWSDDTDPTYEKDAFVRAGRFMMKAINDAMGLNLKPEDLNGD